MTDDLGWVALGVKPDVSGFPSSLSRSISPGMDAESRRIGSRFSAGFKKAAVLGGIGLAGALTAGVKLAFDSLGEAEDSIKVGKQTAAVIKSTGGAARVTEKDVGRLATRLSNMSGIDDELIQSGENVMLTFKGIRNEAGKGNDIFNQGTQIALDMSAALGTDLQGSVIQVGKALNDPVRGITALQRVGVTFSEKQKETIKRMVETGDTLGAQKKILKELTSEFKGSARSQATEGDKLSVAFGNLKEEIGTELLPYMDDLRRFIRKEGIPAVKDFAQWMEDKGVPAIKRLAHFAKDAAGTAKDLIGWLNKLPDPAKYAGLIALVGGVGAAKLKGGGLGGGGALGSAGRALGFAKPIPVVVTNPGFGTGGGGSTPVGAAGGGKLATAAKLTLGIGALYIGGEALKDSGIPAQISSKLFRTDDATDFAKALDGDADAMARMRAKMFAASQEWDHFSDNAKFAFNMVDKAIDNAVPLVKRYQDVLGQTPKQVATTFQINGIDRAVSQADTLIDRLQRAADVARGLDNGVTFQHGGQSGGGTDGRVAAHFGSRP